MYQKDFIMKWEALNYMKKQITINQHYVPRFYMKPFAEVIRKNSNNIDNLILLQMM